MDIINKIQLYVSTPEADMVRTRIAVGHTRVIAKMIKRKNWNFKLTFISGFAPKWQLYMKHDRDGRLRELKERWTHVILDSPGKEFVKESFVILGIADHIFNRL